MYFGYIICSPLTQCLGLADSMAFRGTIVFRENIVNRTVTKMVSGVIHQYAKIGMHSARHWSALIQSCLNDK